MPSRFNQLIEPNKYVSQYVPLPLDFINQQGAAMQKEADTNKKALADSALENLKSISEHDPVRNEYVKGFNDQAQALLNDPNFDFASAEGKAKTYNLIRQHAEDPNVQVFARSIENKKQTLEDWSAIQKSGKGAYWNDPTLQDEKMKKFGIDPYVERDENGKILKAKEYERKIAYASEDHNAPVYALFDKIKDDTDLVAWANFTGDKTAITSGEKGWEGVSADKIANIADANIDTFKNTMGGQDFLRKLHFDYADDFARMDPETAYAAENEKVKEHLYNIGNAYIRNKKIAKAGLSATSLLGKKYDEEQANQITTTRSEGIKNATTQEYRDLDGLAFNQDGSLAPITKGNWVPDPGAVDENGVKDPNAVKWVANNEIDENAVMSAYKKIIEIKKNNPELSKLSDRKAVFAYKKALKDMTSESIPLNSISNVAAKGIGEALSRNLGQRNVYINDGTGTTTDGQLSTVLDELGVSVEDFQKALNNGIGGFTQAAPGESSIGDNAGSYYVQVNDSDGVPRRILINADVEIAGIFSSSQKINNARKSMKRTQFEDKGHIITVEPKILQNGTTEWLYTTEYENPDGTKSVEISKTLLDDVREEEKRALKKSNYLGKQVDVMKPNTTE